MTTSTTSAIHNPIAHASSSPSDYLAQEELVKLYTQMSQITTAYDNFLLDSSKKGELTNQINNFMNFLSFNQNTGILKNNDFDASHNQILKTSKEIADTRAKYDSLLNELYNNEQIFNRPFSQSIDLNIVMGILWVTLISSVVYMIVKYFRFFPNNNTYTK